MIKESTKDVLIKYIISEYNKTSDPHVSIYKSDTSTLNISEREIINVINTLHAENLIECSFMSPHKDLSAPCRIIVLNDCLKYFENKKETKIQNRRELVRTYIPIIISTIALIKSFFT